MNIDQETKNYFNQMHLHRNVDDIKYHIERWLEVMYHKHDIDNRDWIYNKEDIVDEFYNYIITKDGQDEAVV